MKNRNREKCALCEYFFQNDSKTKSKLFTFHIFCFFVLFLFCLLFCDHHRNLGKLPPQESNMFDLLSNRKKYLYISRFNFPVKAILFFVYISPKIIIILNLMFCLQYSKVFFFNSLFFLVFLFVPCNKIPWLSQSTQYQTLTFLMFVFRRKKVIFSVLSVFFYFVIYF